MSQLREQIFVILCVTFISAATDQLDFCFVLVNILMVLCVGNTCIELFSL